MDDDDMKKMLFVYIILGVNDFVKICIGEWLWVGCRGDFVVEFIRFGWIIMLFGVDSGLLFVLLVVNFNVDYEKLCVFDVLGLVDFVIGD